MTHQFKEVDLRRRLKNAKTRARYWSGNPSFAQNVYNPNKCRRSRSEMYEIAMCDIEGLCSLLEDVTGERIPRYDPRAEFQKKWHALNRKVKL